jgi:hypothetical protein
MDETSKQAAASADQPIFLPPGAGRAYDAGPMLAVFKADGAETHERYCVSEWWLEAGQPGPGPHSHEANEELFYVLEGTMSFLAGIRTLRLVRDALAVFTRRNLRWRCRAADLWLGTRIEPFAAVKLSLRWTQRTRTSGQRRLSPLGSRKSCFS